MNKVLIELYIPAIEKKYDVWVPINKRIINVVKLFIKAINDLTRGVYNPSKMPFLYNKTTAEVYDFNAIVKDTDIKNGTELILI